MTTSGATLPAEIILSSGNSTAVTTPASTVTSTVTATTTPVSSTTVTSSGRFVGSVVFDWEYCESLINVNCGLQLYSCTLLKWYVSQVVCSVSGVESVVDHGYYHNKVSSGELLCWAS